MFFRRFDFAKVFSLLQYHYSLIVYFLFATICCTYIRHACPLYSRPYYYVVLFAVDHPSSTLVCFITAVLHVALPPPLDIPAFCSYYSYLTETLEQYILRLHLLIQLIRISLVDHL